MPSESYIEQKLCRYAKRTYGVLSYKQAGPGYRNRPDRFFLFPEGRVLPLEIKRPGKIPTPGQERELQKLRKLGFRADWVDNFDDGKRLIDEFAKRVWVW